MTDPPLLLLLGPIIAFFKGCRLVHWAQDIYPELAEELGVLRGNSWVANLCRGLSTAALRKNSRIIALGRCMKERLLLRGLPEGMIDVVPNWAPGTITADDAQAAANFRRLHDIGSKFVVMYSGNFGLAHSFDEILEAAQALQPKRPDVLFLMVGDGPRLARLKERAAQLQLSILRFIPPQPADALSAVLGSADVHLVTMAPESCGLIVPSKLYGILAAGRPCLFIGPAKSEAALLIEEHQCGAIVSSGAELASSILTWAEHPEQRRATGLRAKAAAMNFTTKTAATEFSRLLRHCVRPLPVIAGARSLASKAA